jgi:hypothetical protein
VLAATLLRHPPPIFATQPTAGRCKTQKLVVGRDCFVTSYHLGWNEGIKKELPELGGGRRVSTEVREAILRCRRLRRFLWQPPLLSLSLSLSLSLACNQGGALKFEKWDLSFIMKLSLMRTAVPLIDYPN